MTRYDDRRKRKTTREGFTGYIAPEIKDYFLKRYEEQEWRVVPGHWPTMETKEDVDKWIENENKLVKILEEL